VLITRAIEDYIKWLRLSGCVVSSGSPFANIFLPNFEHKLNSEKLCGPNYMTCYEFSLSLGELCETVLCCYATSDSIGKI